MPRLCVRAPGIIAVEDGSHWMDAPQNNGTAVPELKVERRVSFAQGRGVLKGERKHIWTLARR